MKTRYVWNFFKLCSLLVLLTAMRCEECDEITEGAESADLLLSQFESEIDETTDVGIAFNIIHTIINTAAGFECPEEVAKAGAHSDGLTLIFSSDEEFTDPQVVGTQTMVVNQSTDPNESYAVVSQVSFEQDGFYLLENSIDTLDEVPERDETNNNDVNTPKSTRGLSFVLDKQRVIHINSNGNAGTPNLDPQTGKVKYISSWISRVEY